MFILLKQQYKMKFKAKYFILNLTNKLPVVVDWVFTEQTKDACQSVFTKTTNNQKMYPQIFLGVCQLKRK